MYDILNPEQEKAALDLAQRIGLQTSPDFLPFQPRTHKKNKSSLTDWRHFLSKYRKTQQFFNHSQVLTTQQPPYDRNILMTSEGFSRKKMNLNERNHNLTHSNYQETQRAQTARTLFRTGRHTKETSKKINENHLRILQGSKETKRKKSLLKNLVNTEYQKKENPNSDIKKKKRNFSVKMKFNPKVKSFQFCL